MPPHAPDESSSATAIETDLPLRLDRLPWFGFPLVAWKLAVAAEQRSLEQIAAPLAATRSRRHNAG